MLPSILLFACDDWMPDEETDSDHGPQIVSVETLPEPTEDESSESSEEPPPRIMLRRPPLPSTFPAHPSPDAEESLLATAYQYNAAIFEQARADSSILGIVRRGRTLPVEERVYGSGCTGRWYRIGRGFLCTGQGFVLGEAQEPSDQRRVRFDRPMPYRYAAVARRDGVPRLFRPPTADELSVIEELEAEESLPEVVAKQMVGDFFVALDRTEGSWQRTVRGRYVHVDELQPLETPKLVGARLEGDSELPLAFVFGESRPLVRIDGEDVQEVGEAEQYARFTVEEVSTVDGVEYAIGAGGLAVRRESVRVARRSRPDEAVASDNWIHVDLAEQTLVAYADGEPVYATLVASGREGYDTPRGVFRIREKYVSATMDGSDPVDGDFEVEEVPWTMYYWGSFALHGAYWHDDFGQVRSHGCTNLAPADARWLFEWSSPSVPDGWHGYRNSRGTWVWLSRGDAEYEQMETAG
ncbi:MAG: hypothetical protein ACI9KE_006351 [Polyangiales bacterium]